jgi:hypothetical protein
VPDHIGFGKTYVDPAAPVIIPALVASLMIPVAKVRSSEWG